MSASAVPSTTGTPPPPRHLVVRLIEWTPAVALAVSLVLRAVSMFRRSYAQDDFFFAYTAWLRSGPGVPMKDYYLANFTPLAEAAAPLFRIFPESFLPLYIVRAVMLVVGVLLVFTVYRAARELGAPLPWAVMAAAVVSCQYHFTKRIGDLRSDQIMSLFAFAGVLILLGARQRVRAALAGLMFGIAVAVSYKILVAAPFVGIGLLMASRGDRARDAVRFTLAAAVAPLLYFGTWIAIDGWPLFLAVWREVFGAVGGGMSDRWRTLINATIAAPLPVLACFAGLAGLFLRIEGDLVMTARRRAFAVLSFAFFATYVAANPFIFPYNMAILMPVAGIWTAGLPRIVSRGSIRVAILVLVPLLQIWGSRFGTYETINFTNEAQERVVRWIWSSTGREEAVFDWQGFAFGRPSTFHWWHYSGLEPKYASGWYSVAGEIRRSQVKLLIPNYRFGGLTPDDGLFIRTHFVQIDTCLLAPGWAFDASQLRSGVTFDAFLRDGVYQAQPASAGGILIDGAPVRPEQRLTAGPHHLALAPGAAAPPSFALFFTTPGRQSAPPPCQGAPMIAWYN